MSSTSLALVEFTAPGRRPTLAAFIDCESLDAVWLPMPVNDATSLGSFLADAAERLSVQRPDGIVTACASYPMALAIAHETARIYGLRLPVVGLDPTDPGVSDLQAVVADAERAFGMPQRDAALDQLAPLNVHATRTALLSGASLALDLPTDDPVVHELTDRYVTWLIYVGLCIEAAGLSTSVERLVLDTLSARGEPTDACASREHAMHLTVKEFVTGTHP